MNHQSQNAMHSPKSPYQIFIEENNQLLNSITQNEIQFQSNSNDIFESNLKEEGNSENEYYESLKDSLDSINAQLGITSKRKEEEKINTEIRDIEKSRDDSIAKIDSQSDILPSNKDVCPSPLDKRKRKDEDKYSISSEKSKHIFNSERDDKFSSKDKNSQHSINNKKSNASIKSNNSGLISKSSSNKNNVINTPVKERTNDRSKQISTLQNDDNSVFSFQSHASSHKKMHENSDISNRSQSASIKKNNSFSSNQNDALNIRKEDSIINGQTQNIKRENSVSSDHNQASNIKQQNSVISNHSQTPKAQKENSIISNHSQASSISKENYVNSDHNQTSNIKQQNSIISNHSQTPKAQKENSIISNHSQASSINKENYASSDHNQTSNIKQQNSVISNHSQTPKAQKENSIISNHSQSSNAKKSNSFSASKSMITTSYIDYIDTKQKRILEKWKNEDLEAQRNLEEEMIDKLLTPKHTWKTFKFTSPRPSISSRSSVSNETKTEISSNLNDDDDIDKSINDSSQSTNQVFEMPPNPSANFKQMLEIPAIERLITPKKNFSMQQQKTNKQNSTRPKRIKPVIEDDFLSRQAHYENEKRLRKTLKENENQMSKSKKRDNDEVFNKLYEKSIVDDFESSDNGNDLDLSNKNQNKNKIKWSNKSHLVESKKIPVSQPPINTSDFRNDRFSPMSQKFAQNESRSFQERTSIDFDDILKQNREEQEQKKKRDLYNQHLEQLD